MKKRGRTRPGVTWDELCRLALALPGVTKSTSYGTPAVKVGGELIARLREDGETVALRMGFIERDAWMGSDPATFFITDHYLKYPAVCVRLASVKLRVMKRLLEETWQWVAPKRRAVPTGAKRTHRGKA